MKDVLLLYSFESIYLVASLLGLQLCILYVRHVYTPLTCLYYLTDIWNCLPIRVGILYKLGSILLP